MNLEQAREYSFLVKWKVAECFSGSGCWCRRILPVGAISYNDDTEEYEIVPDGAIDQKTAEYMVELHNNKIEKDRNISNDIRKILQQKSSQDYGISQ